ncbi:MAG: triose-phosphate isomerase family protein [Bacilli bacterium]|nr:triose-phosphate isomerase family protein [Bacilli bacterium]
MRKTLVCNHKMFLTYDEAEALEKSISTIQQSNVDLIICPSYLNMPLFKEYNLCAQDCFYEDKGPYTGQVSPYQLSLLGVRYVLLGHSEKREFDTDEIINSKVKATLRNGMTPILCIGETKTERDLMKTPEVLSKQLKVGLKGVSLSGSEEIFIAYEPRWVIGGDKCLSKAEIEDTFRYLKKILSQMNISSYKLLYGGAITANNVKNLMSDMVEGYLIGNSSVSFSELYKIIKCIK